MVSDYKNKNSLLERKPEQKWRLEGSMEIEKETEIVAENKTEVDALNLPPRSDIYGKKGRTKKWVTPFPHPLISSLLILFIILIMLFFPDFYSELESPSGNPAVEFIKKSSPHGQ